jgi:putative membrane protein
VSARARSGSPARWFALAGTAVVLADSPPVHAMADRSFTGHMLQHLLLLVVAAPALVLARPVETLAGLLPRRPVALARARRRRYDAAMVLVRPALAIVILVVIHVTSIYERALRSGTVHLLEHAGFVAAGWCLWSSVLASRVHRGAWRVASAFGATAATALLGMVLATSDPISATYVRRQGAAAALRDQQLGASLMWVGGMALTLPLVMVAVWRWAAAEERAEHRREQLASGAPFSSS